MGHGMKILVVDDEPIFLELIKKYLGAIGCDNIHTVPSAIKALETIGKSQRPFDCCLLDIRMPGIDGVELCRKIRSLPGYGTVPIVMITSMTDKSYIDHAFQAGANDYVTKPIDTTELSARMGMVKALVAERANAGRLTKELEETSFGGHRYFKFEDSLPLEDAGDTVLLSSLENYLLRLGNIRLFGSAAVAFHVQNADLIYDQTDLLEFADIMCEVALAIKECLIGINHLLAYVGSGDFCCIQPRTGYFDTTELQIAVNDKVAQRLGALEWTNVALPALKVGNPCSNGLVSFNDPTDLIYKSIHDARKQPGKILGSRNSHLERSLNVG